MMKRTSERSAEPEAAEPEILVTGATGFVGRWLVAALTRQGHVVAALVRGAAQRGGELRESVARLGGDASKLVVLEGDVERPDLGLGRELPGVRVVHHLAARFAFGLTRADAHATNVRGTEHVMRWAARLPQLERFIFAGGYRMTARRGERLDEAEDARAYASGAYEGSKHEAYAVFRRLAAELGLPWTAVHPSGVIGDSRTGETLQLTGLGETVRQLFEGRLRALAGTARTFVPVVTVDYLADYLASVPSRAASEGKDLVVFDPESPPLPELVAMLARILGVPAPTRVLPLRLVSALPTSWTGLHPEARAFLVEDRYDTAEGESHARAVGLAHPRLESALARWCAFLLATRFLTAPAPGTSARLDGGTFVTGDARSAEVVLVHGIPFDGEAMMPLARALDRPAAVPDLPGLGRSGARAGDVGPAWLRALLSERSRPAVLVGHSLGASVVACYAAAHDDVAALVLVAPSFLQAPASWTLHLRPVVARVLAGLDARGFKRRFLAGTNASAATDSALAALARKGGARRYAAALSEAISRSHRAAAQAAYAALRARGVPTLIVHGDAEVLAHDPLGAHVIVIAGAGHAPHLTHTEEVARAVRSFLDASDAESATVAEVA